MLHMQQFQQQQIHCKVALLAKDIQWYSKEMLHILHEVQLNLQIYISHKKDSKAIVNQLPRVELRETIYILHIQKIKLLK